MTQNGNTTTGGMPNGARLLALARDKSLAGRESLASSVAGIFTAQSDGFSDDEKTIAHDILRALVRDVEKSVRAALAANLAASAAAPRDVILALANDDIDVAFPVLTESPVLEDPELIQIVAERTTGHRLAVSMRPKLGETVSDAVIATGDKEAIACLLHNNEAMISKAALTALVQDAKLNDDYHEPLSGRPDLGADLAFNLAAAVAKVLQDKLVETYDLDEDKVREAAADAVVDAAQALSKPDAAEVHSARRREVRQMIETLRRKEWPHFEAAMVRFSGISPRLTHAILAERDGRKFTVLCRACGVLKSDFASLFLLSRRATPDAEIVDADDVRGALELFDKIERKAATRVLARWRAQSNPGAKR